MPDHADTIREALRDPDPSGTAPVGTNELLRARVTLDALVAELTEARRELAEYKQGPWWETVDARRVAEAALLEVKAELAEARAYADSQDWHTEWYEPMRNRAEAAEAERDYWRRNYDAQYRGSKLEAAEAENAQLRAALARYLVRIERYKAEIAAAANRTAESRWEFDTAMNRQAFVAIARAEAAEAENARLKAALEPLVAAVEPLMASKPADVMPDGLLRYDWTDGLLRYDWTDGLLRYDWTDALYALREAIVPARAALRASGGSSTDGAA